MYRVPIWALRIVAGRERNPSIDQIFFLFELLTPLPMIPKAMVKVNTTPKTPNIILGNMIF